MDGHIQARLPRGDGIKARYAGVFSWGKPAAARPINAPNKMSTFQHRAPPMVRDLCRAPSKPHFSSIRANLLTDFAFLDAARMRLNRRSQGVGGRIEPSVGRAIGIDRRPFDDTLLSKGC